MAWKAISAQDWTSKADEDFWSPYGRKRSDRAKSQMVRKQFETLKSHDSQLALEFAEHLATHESESHIVRAQCFLQQLLGLYGTVAAMSKPIAQMLWV